MWCPACRTEYRPGFERCSDCGAVLVHRLDDDPADNWVSVLSTTDPAFLPVARSVLEAAGIPHLVQGEAGVSLFPLGAAAARVTNRVTGAVILVRERDRSEAEAVLHTPPNDVEDEV